MAAVVLTTDHSNIDWRQFYTQVTNYLPMYACPKFIRIRENMAVTSTFKHTKVELVKEGFDPDQITDTLYVMDASQKTFVLLDHGVYQDILDGKVKL